MIHKKSHFLALYLFFLSSIATGCMKLIEAKKTTDEDCMTLFDRKLKYEKDILEIKNEFRERHKSKYIVRGCNPSASTFLYSLYTAANGRDFDNALMAKGEFFIELYCKEHIEGCSVLGIIAIANSVPFVEKKEFIQKLLYKKYDCKDDLKAKHEFRVTLKDKEFAFFAKFKEFSPSIIQEIHWTRDIHAELHIPQNVKDHIAKLLFRLKFDDKESLL
jgi:hypothetical protein